MLPVNTTIKKVPIQVGSNLPHFVYSPNLFGLKARNEFESLIVTSLSN